MNGVALPFQQTATTLNSDQTAFEVGIGAIGNVPGLQSVAILGTNLGSGGLPGNVGPSGVGVRGVSDFFRGVEGVGGLGAGVFGTSTGSDGVLGETNSDAHAGVSGVNLTQGANGGIGVYGQGGRFAGEFDGTLQVNGDANITGTLNVTTDITLSPAASDCAEDFDVAADDVEPGTVMVLDDSGSLRPSEQGYDRKVAGVISGAGDFRPGMILGRDEFSRQRVPIALVGKVFCKVDATHGAISVGDLLTTSNTIGHAMRADDPSRSLGSIIGKALKPLAAGCGLIPILVALQ